MKKYVKKMKVLYLHISQNLGGVEKRFATLYLHLLADPDRNTTVIMSRSFISKLPFSPKIKGCNRLIKYGFVHKKSGRFSRYLDYLSLVFILLLIFQKKYDVAHFPTSGSRLFFSYVRAGKKVVSEVTSYRKWLERDLHSPQFQRAIKRGAYVDCLDSNIAEAVRSAYSGHKRQVFAAPCSFADYAGTECVFSKKERAICFCGRLIEIKGTDILLEILEDLLNRTSWKIYILGNGDQKHRFVDYLEKHKVHDRMIVGYTSNPKEYLKKTMLFLSLQSDENYPSQSLLEAMACSNIPLATNVGLTGQLVRKDFGFLVSDASDLLRVLISLENESLDVLEQMGLQARKFVIQRHNVQLYSKYLFESVYKGYQSV